MTPQETNWNGRIKLACYSAGESFNYEAGTAIDWPGGVAEAARYCVRGHAVAIDDKDKPMPVMGEFADRLWAMSGLLKSNPLVLLKGRAKAAAEAAMIDAVAENAALPAAGRRGPGRQAKARQTVPPDEVELADEDA